MKLKFDDFPGWEFDIEEVSAGVYRATGGDQFGHRTARTGVDPQVVLEECKAYAVEVTSSSEPPARTAPDA